MGNNWQDMLVKEMTIEVHEKRDNPHAFGHYDVGVSVTVLSGGGTADDVYNVLANFVREKCDAWEISARERHRIEELQKEINGEILGLTYVMSEEQLRRATHDIASKISGLPVDKRGDLFSAMANTTAEVEAQIKEYDKRYQGG